MDWLQYSFSLKNVSFSIPFLLHHFFFHLIFFHLNFTINFISKINLILNYQPHIVIILNRRYREISKFLYHICQKFGKLDHWMVRKNHNITKWESAIAQENASYAHFLKNFEVSQAQDLVCLQPFLFVVFGFHSSWIFHHTYTLIQQFTNLYLEIESVKIHSS